MIVPAFDIKYESSDKNLSIVVDNKTIYASDDFQYNKLGDFKFEDTYSMCLIKLDDLNFSYSFHKERKYKIDSIKRDGAYKIYNIILPDKKWVESNIKPSNDTIVNAYLDNDNVMYSSDGSNIYKTEYSDEVPVTNIISFEDFINEAGSISLNSLFEVNEDFISIKNLVDCYLSLCRKILDCGTLSCCNNRMENSNEILFKRDMVWMTINAINILSEKFISTNDRTYLDEINSIINRVSGCNGFCNYDSINIRSGSCGCGK